MGLLSFGRRKEEAAGDDSGFTAPAAQDTAGARPKARRKGRAADPIDPVLPEKQRARRRLVGAVALVLAAVIGLPMILDPEPKPLPSDISIDIPAKDKAKPAPAASAPVAPAAALDPREEIVTPDSATAPANAKAGVPAAAAGAAAAGAAVAASAATRSEPAKPEAKVEAKSDVKADAKADNKAEAKADGKPQAKAESKPEPKTEVKADAKADAHKADNARARAILDGRDAQADKHETYMVQVAALASADKVRELQNKLKAAGIKSQTQKVATQSGERIRVRVGPLANRSEAEKMRTRLNKLGLNGTLVPV
jgi:DedD protein